MVDKLKKLLSNPKIRFGYFARLRLLNYMSSERFLKKEYLLSFGKELNLDNPRTFNEKLQWLKLYDRKDIYTTMVDKAEAKKYVADRISEKYIIPTIGVYDKFDDINFDNLPNQFVIKCTHDSGGLVIYKDKVSLDKKKAKKRIEKSLKRNYYYSGREWPYKNIKPRIIVEKYVGDDLIDDLRDYKFMCFNGKPKYVYITVKNRNIFENYYDMYFHPVNIDHGFPKSSISFPKPKPFEEMKQIAEKLAKETAFLRVDLSYVWGKMLFREMTFYDWGGLRPFADGKWDSKLGKMINLKSIKEEDN